MSKSKLMLNKFLTPEWLTRGVMIAFLVANLYISDKFVAKAEHKADLDRLAIALTSLQTSVNTLNMNLELLKQQSQSISDHEARLRTLERTSNKL